MARRTPVPLRKRRTREHVIADLGINYVERQVLLAGFTVERILHDYGIDLELFTYAADGTIQLGSIPLQVKATERARRVDRGAAISIRIERTDLLAWLSCLEPVILVVYDVTDACAWWLYVQADFAARGVPRPPRLAATVSLRIPIEQRLTVDAVRRFAEFRDRALAPAFKVVRHHD
jgi:hypothetical protein